MAKIGFRRWGREVTGALPSGTDISNGIKEQEPKSFFEVENTSGTSQSTSPSCSMPGGVQQRSCKSNAISRRWGSSRAQTRNNEERRPVFNRSSSAGEGGVKRMPHLCQANSLQLRTGSPQTGLGGVPQRGWRFARHLAGRSNVERGRPQRGRPARGLRHQLRGAPAALRQRGAPASNECSTVAAYQHGNAVLAQVSHYCERSHLEQLRLVRQGDRHSAIIEEVETTVRGDGVNGICRHDCRSLVGQRQLIKTP